MSQLSSNEIRARLTLFAEQFAVACDENAESQSFWDLLFRCYGTNRREVARYEARVRKRDGNSARIDLLWKGRVLVEQKSRGRDLASARDQALEYVERLPAADRPRWVVTCDFANFEVEDLQTGERTYCTLADLPARMEVLGFLSGAEIKRPLEEAPINVEAVGRLGSLYDAMKEGGYPDHDLQEFLVRIMFCLFAEDTGVFEPESFTDLITERTAEDGSNLGVTLNYAFETLNKELERRQKALEEHLAILPYVNGKLFERRLEMLATNSTMRKALLNCAKFDWSNISPAIFGSLFQGVMDSVERRTVGAHYTSEENIQKVIQPLFMEELWREFTSIRTGPQRGREAKLQAFHDKLAALRIFDPACGCGNFLIVAYRDLRRLEIELLKELHPHGQLELDVTILSKLDVDQFYGIEIDEFPAQIAKVALWLMDHVMNVELGHAFGQVYRRLPLTKAANIHHANALRLDWRTVLSPDQCSYVLGNPPFVGGKYQKDEQKADLRAIAGAIQNHGLLDYVACWFIKAAHYIDGTRIQCAFVATNSITQGEQVGILWPYLLSRGIRINFAHRTFSWQSEARGQAHVHVVIVGFSRMERQRKRIYAHDMPEAPTLEVSRINPYLADGPDIVVSNRSKPLCAVPQIGIGNKPIDGGHYLFEPEEKAEFLELEEDAAPYFKKWVGSEEFINGKERWVLWLGDASPAELRRLPECLKRIEAVKSFRLASKSPGTRKIAATPTRYHVENFPQGNYMVIPEVSSERRQYIPIGYIGPEIIASNKVRLFPDATPYHFGILTSAMHMAWMRHVCGRLKSDYQYSVKLVYNNFPWPEASESQQERVGELAQAVLSARANHPDCTLADLYHPISMPADLSLAHQALDRAVDRLYRSNGFATDMERFAHLIELYDRMANGGLVKNPVCKKIKHSRNSAAG
jgi:type I restriction-modification system DNA methylase subunit